MKTSILAKIKRENARFEKTAPYNFCDRWCEKCPKKKRAGCRVYHEEFEKKLQHLANGRDPDDIYVMLDDLEKSLKGSTGAIDKWSKEEEVDLSELDAVEYNKSTAKHPLRQLALDYLDRVRNFLYESYDENSRVEDSLFNFYETVHWYCMPIMSKSLIILYSIEAGNFSSYCNAVSQIDILKKACLQSQKALNDISKQKITHRYQISALLGILRDISRQIKKIEKYIDNLPTL
ncbi:MAG: hypothetical protein HQ566_04195 [Candidatus Omnitrophica bacterium]|nr:hypothetical protein [Candidatus Omnitrophota bacterium]